MAANLARDEARAAVRRKRHLTLLKNDPAPMSAPMLAPDTQVERNEKLTKVHDAFTGLNLWHLLLQPMDGPNRQANTERAIAYCLANPLWKLSLQTHKVLGIP